MKIDLDWIQKELDAGREVELECVNREGFDDGLSSVNLVILKQDKLTVKSIDELSGIIYLHGDYIIARNNCIVSKEFKHFRIKRPDPTFDDLIDVTVKANSNGFITEISLIKTNSGRVLDATYSNEINGSFGFVVVEKECYDFQPTINEINSLYTETFVIEGDSDIERLRDGAKITLTNNEKGVFNIISGLRSITNIETGAEIMGLNTFWLKGATVTQKK